MTWGNDHSHNEYADKRDLQYVEDQIRDLRVDLNRAEHRIEDVRTEVLDFVRTSITGLSEWIRDVADQIPAPAKGDDQP